jgi:hypothetical protein
MISKGNGYQRRYLFISEQAKRDLAVSDSTHWLQRDDGQGEMLEIFENQRI